MRICINSRIIHRILGRHCGIADGMDGNLLFFEDDRLISPVWAVESPAINILTVLSGVLSDMDIKASRNMKSVLFISNLYLKVSLLPY